MSKIFLSHTSQDKTFVRKIASDLRRFGHTVWIDEAEINIGDSLIGKIREGLDSVDYVAVVLSNASIKSEWVQKEIEIASNREIEERKIIVLPLIIEDVELPGFLKGKFYGDFSKEEEYDEKLNLLLRSLGDSYEIIKEEASELEKLKREIANIKLIAESHKKEADELKKYNLLSKDDKLLERIEQENKDHPEYAPINNVYSFMLGDVPVTLGYMLWVLGKIQMQGSHQMELILDYENKWDYADRMIQAYAEMVNSKE